MRARNPALSPGPTTAVVDTSLRSWSSASLVLFDSRKTTQAVERGEGLAPLGFISAHEPDIPCDNAFQVGVAVSVKGWGPVLYDVLLGWDDEHRRAGIIPSRDSIQPSARAVWEFYATRRRDEVLASQMPHSCVRYPDEPHLDAIYLASREDRSLLRLYKTLVRRGEGYLRWASGAFSVTEANLRKQFHTEGVGMFVKHLERSIKLGVG